MSDAAKDKTTPQDKDNRRNKAYAVATATLRVRHRDEFNELLRGQYEAMGLEPKFRKTAEEKAAAEAARLEARAAKEEAKRLAKVEALEAQLLALKEPLV